jgi:zinc/manganese transport system permease protein
MVPAFAECLVLVGIDSYLGLHVIKRKVIFVDLALAQIAALGATVGFLFGMDPASPAAFIFSMAFTFIGAAVFALTRLRDDRVPQEAVIGLVYALAAAVAILVIDKSPHGAEHIKNLLTGTILWVKWPEIIQSAVAYSFVGVFHFVLRRRFILISEDPDAAFRAGVWVRFWDFLFYLSFGFVITFSVRTAGVLLVFVFLVAPAITATMLTDKWSFQLVVGWVMGTVVTVVALGLSYVLDLPSGPTVVAFYGVVLLVVALALYVANAEKRSIAARRLGIGFAATAAVLTLMWLLGHALGSSSWARDEAHHHVSQILHDHGRHEHENEDHGSDGGTGCHAPESLPDRQLAEDPETRLRRISTCIDRKDTGWRQQLVEAALDPELPLLFKDQALTLLRLHAKTDFGYDADDPTAAGNAEAAAKIRAWARKATPPP